MGKKGQTIIFYGHGKGKTSAAIGTAIRSIQAGRKVAFLQFIKGNWITNEEKFLSRQDNIKFVKFGAGFVRNKKSIKHKKAFLKGIGRAVEILENNKYDLVVLDEILTGLELGLISSREIELLLSKKPLALDLVLTGRKATKKIVELSDTASEIKKIKHIFDNKVLAKKGLDF